MIFLSENIFLLLVILGYYYLLAIQLKTQTQLLYTSYYIVNMTSLVFATEYIFFVFTIKARVIILNRLMKQLLFDDFDNNSGDPNVKTPTIAYDEIFTIYGKSEESKKHTKPVMEKPNVNPTAKNTLFKTFRILFNPFKDSSM